ncbi:MAG: MBL fold metallo-hydrolase [Hyphomicrobiales bacterium]|nr:MBL fold metallo-hydrolase [Hyphomicrobiales bacterium]MCP5370382.1 MBL fold metallo-hydrolase [Hyphomicrobiales bacterium]
MARLTFHGATEGVTGSAYLLRTDRARVLLECGLVQGGRQAEAANRDPFPFDPRDLDAVILSHAHLDHSGLLPRLVAEGYAGPVYMTHPTAELLDIMLRDAAFLEQRDTEWENKFRRRAGKDELAPLYTVADVEAALARCAGLEYGVRTVVAPGVDVRLSDAGHILGSAVVEVFVNEGGAERKLAFSGDLGNSSAALLRDPARIAGADLLLLESTYGDRDHRPMDETLDELERIVTAAAEDGGNILIPAFAVGRTQEVIFRLGELFHAGKLDRFRVYLDSPMAIAATGVYQRHQDEFNRADRTLIRRARGATLPAFLPSLRYSRTTEESMALNRVTGGAIIIAGSGMCNGGRIRHHLKHNLWRRSSHVVIVGFQAAGTPGRALVDGARTFHLGGEEIAVKAAVHTLGGFSAHASQSQLLDWVQGFTERRPRICLVHGEDAAKAALAARLAGDGWRVEVPRPGQAVEL